MKLYLFAFVLTALALFGCLVQVSRALSGLKLTAQEIEQLANE